MEKIVGLVLHHSWASQQPSSSQSSEAAAAAARLSLKTSVKGKLLQLVSSVLPAKTNGFFVTLPTSISRHQFSSVGEREWHEATLCWRPNKGRWSPEVRSRWRGLLEDRLSSVFVTLPLKIKYNCVIAYESSAVLFTDTQWAPLDPSVWSWTATLSWGAINPSFCLLCCANRPGCLKSTFSILVAPRVWR